jgi:hypothetical protein
MMMREDVGIEREREVYGIYIYVYPHIHKQRERERERERSGRPAAVSCWHSEPAARYT